MRSPVRITLQSLAVVALLPAAACTTTTGPGGMPVASAPVSTVDPALARPCIDAAAAKYYVMQDRASALSADQKGKVYEVKMKVDTRDALCTVTSKGKVVSVVDTTPMGADQLAADKKAEEAKTRALQKVANDHRMAD